MATASKPSKSKAKPIGNGAVAKAPRKAASSPRKAKVGKPPSEATEAASGLPEASGAPWREDARVQYSDLRLAEPVLASSHSIAASTKWIAVKCVRTNHAC